MKMTLVALALAMVVSVGLSARPETLRLASTLGLDGMKSAAMLMTQNALCEAMFHPSMTDDKRLIASLEISARGADCVQPHHAAMPAI